MKKKKRTTRPGSTARNGVTRSRIAKTGERIRRRRPSPKKARRAGNPPRRRRNSSEIEAAARLSEKFHGRKAHKVTEVTEEVAERLELADLGRLLWLDVRTVNGDQARINFSGGTRLASSPDGGQLYFVAGNQEIDLKVLGLSKDMPKDHITVGEAAKIAYHTKKGFHKFEPIDYWHKFGEEGGRRPTLHYDTLSRSLYLSGGSYQVKAEGIVN